MYAYRIHVYPCICSIVLLSLYFLVHFVCNFCRVGFSVLVLSVSTVNVFSFLVKKNYFYICFSSCVLCVQCCMHKYVVVQEVTCKVGCGTLHDGKCAAHSGSSKFSRYVDVKDSKAQSETKSSKSLWSRMILRKSMSDMRSEPGSDVNAVIGGVPACIYGQFGEVIVFMEPLLDSQVQSLFKLGMTTIFFVASTLFHHFCVTFDTTVCDFHLGPKPNFDFSTRFGG